MIPPLRACTFPLPFGENFTPPTPSNSLLLPPSGDHPTTIAAAALSAPEVMSIEFSGNPLGPSFVESTPIRGQISQLAWRFNLIPFVDAFACYPVPLVHHPLPASAAGALVFALLLSYLFMMFPQFPPLLIWSLPLLMHVLLLPMPPQATSLLPLMTYTTLALSGQGLPQLYFDQLLDIRKIQQSLHTDFSIPKASRLTRKGLQSQPDWLEWLAAEFHQLYQYAQQDMFGDPCPPPLDASIFHWVWIYKIKEEEQTEKRLGLFVIVLLVGAKLKFMVPNMHPPLT